MKAHFLSHSWLLIILINFIPACTTQKFSSQKENLPAAEINAQLSLSYLQLGDVERAKQKILLAHQQAPHDPLIWYSQAYFLEKTGESVAAEKAYLKAISLANHNGAAHNNYGAFLCRRGRYSSAISQFLLASQDPDYLHVGDTYENAGICAMKIPDTTLARKFFQQALAANPDLPEAKLRLQQL